MKNEHSFSFQNQSQDGEESESRHLRSLLFRSGSSEESLGADEETGQADHSGDHAETSDDERSTLTSSTDSTVTDLIFCSIVPEF